MEQAFQTVAKNALQQEAEEQLCDRPPRLILSPLSDNSADMSTIRILSSLTRKVRKAMAVTVDPRDIIMRHSPTVRLLVTQLSL